MEFVSREPRDELAGIATRVWALRMPTPRDREKILPLPSVHLILNLGEPYRVVERGGEPVSKTVAGAFVSGIQDTYVINENPAVLHHVGIEVRPHCWGAFSATAAAGQVREVAGELPALAAAREELAAMPLAHALDRFEELLVAAVRPQWRPHETVADAVAAIHADPSAPVADVARAVGVGPQRLRALFAAHVGLSPKRFAIVARHHAFLQSVPQQPPFPRWADLVSNAGYYDEPHFVRSFARLTGLTPRVYLAAMTEAGERHFLEA